MKTSFKTGVLGIGALALSALIFAGCSQRTQSTDAGGPIAEVPQDGIATTGAPSSSAQKSAGQSSKKPAQKLQAQKIRWEPTLTTAMAQARKTQKPIMIDFYATWCGPCKMLDAQIYPAQPVVQEAQNFISVKVDVDKEQSLAMQYQIQAMPTIVFLDASGKEVHRTQGVSDQPSWFVQEMQTARSKISTTAA